MRSILERSDFTDRFLHRRLGCCGPTGSQPWGPYCEDEEVKEVLGFVAEVTVCD
jgi:hypothetical protein